MTIIVWHHRQVPLRTGGPDGRWGPRRGGKDETGHDDAAIATKNKGPPATCKLWEPGHRIGTSRTGLQKEESLSEVRGGADQSQPRPERYAKRAPAGRSLELAWQPWDATRR